MGADAPYSREPAAGQIGCSMAAVLLRLMRARGGGAAVADLLRRADSERTPSYLDDVGNWIDYEEAIALFVAAAEITGDPRIGRRVGEEMVRQHAGTPVATLLRSLGSPEAILEQTAVTVTKFSTVTAMEPLDVAPGRAVVSASARAGFRRHRHLCDWTSGVLSQPTVLFGLAPAVVEESECEVEGDARCLYTVTWDAEHAAGAADPQQLVTALEGQLVAMADRLDSMYATARDLISPEDLDGALGRITERAATAVRAPRYLLAVRTPPGDELHIHHRGFAGDEVDEAARALLDADPHHDSNGSRLVVDVRSKQRHYGRLLAVYPTEQSFFPQERDLFQVYGRFAATVLDTATALDDARRRHDEARVLLELSRSVAAAGTSDEVAQRLAEAVRGVVDCDSTAVFVWQEEEEALACKAVFGAAERHAERLCRLRMTPSDTPHLREMLEARAMRPLFFGADTEDRYVRGLMEEFGAGACVVVPIAARSKFFGTLHVTVTSDPDRLRPCPALTDRLAGVVAQAATALGNGRLVDRITQEARRDSLTGLLGHRAFHEELQELVAAGSEAGRFALAAVDIDDFKVVNDTHGHPVGDEALRHVAETLRCGIREGDRLFRLGGEEFSVIMPGVGREEALAAADRMRLAVERAPFRLPLRVSVGVAVRPDDGVECIELIARADAALYAAKASGKNRTCLPSDETPAAVYEAHSGLLELLRRRDAGSVTHSAHVANVAVVLGQALGLRDERLQDLHTAAQLHDVGKVAVPQAILAKQGPLTPYEHRIVQTHPTVGAELLRAWGLERPAQHVLEHHERVDGTGYPTGLSGDEIGLEARILHVSDAFVAMTLARPYGATMTPEEALAELHRQSGSKFDPAVVGALERIRAAAEAAVGAPDGQASSAGRRYAASE
jgi:diguanylate cyclase (GGDEF)-like protein